MPYQSQAQQRFFHSPGAARAGITSAQVAEFDAASKGMKLPERAAPAEKSAALTSLALKQSALVPPPKPPTTPVRSGTSGTVTPTPTKPGGTFRSTMRDASSSKAFSASDNKLDAGDALTMPSSD